MNYKSKLLTNPRLNKYRMQEIKNYLQITIMIVLLSIFIGFAIRPSIKTALELRKRIQEYSGIEQKYDQKILDLRKIRNTYSALSQEIKLLDKALPSNPEEGNLLKTLNFLSAKNGLMITRTSFTYSNSSTETNLGELEFTITLRGQYENLVSFISQLQSLLRVNTVESIEIRPESGANSRILVNIKGKAYYVLQEK